MADTEHTDPTETERLPRRRRRRTGRDPHVQRGQRRARLRRSTLGVVPTLLTLGNLICGFAAIHYAAKPLGESVILGWSTLTVAGTLIFLGMFFDAIDGSVARLTNSTSELGAMLDSLSDMVSFGVAPAYMMLRLVSHYYVGETGTTAVVGPEADDVVSRLVWGIAAVYVCCTALRLARFNVETTTAAEDHAWFAGLPSPGAAGTIASLILLHQHLLVHNATTGESLAFARAAAFGLPVITLLCALAMVSRLRYVHFANRFVSGPRDFGYVARIVVPIMLAIWWFQVTLAAAFTAYALSGAIGLLGARARSTSTDRSEPLA